MHHKHGLRIVILGNNDITSNIVMSRIASSENISIIAIADTATLVSKEAGGRIRQAVRLMRRMALEYWMFLVFTNVMFNIRQMTSILLKFVGFRGDVLSLREAAFAYGIPYFVVKDFNSSEFKHQLKQWKPDLLIIRINQILDHEFLSIPKYGTWCLHSSLLPAYGGYAAEFHAMKNGEQKIGSTLFNVDETVDQGKPLFQSYFSTRSDKSLFWHLMKNNSDASILVKESLQSFAMSRQVVNNILEPPQAHSYYRWPQPADFRKFQSRNATLITFKEILVFMSASMFPLGMRSKFLEYIENKLLIDTDQNT